MSKLVIVAIPSEDDYVTQVSSEEVPHLTLLYLGEAGTADNLEQIMGFVEHASNLIEPFYMDVEHRGTLGEDNADVIFFEKGWDYKMVQTYRDQLKQNPAIKAAYNSAEQYPEWRPHLTLGYPDTPANPLEKDRRLYSVRFDRIAVWDGDFTGMEFRLKRQLSSREMAMADVPKTETALSHFRKLGEKWGIKRTVRAGNVVTQGAETPDELLHYGIKGMRWGHRNSDRALGSGGNRAGGTPGIQKVSVKGAVQPVAQRVSATTARLSPGSRHDRKQAKLENRFPKKDPEYRVVVTKKGDRKIETRGGRSNEPAPEAVNARVLNQQRRASGIQSLSNKQLQELSTRLNLEQQVTRLSVPQNQSKITSFVKKQLVDQKDREKNVKNAKAIQEMMSSKKTPSPR